MCVRYIWLHVCADVQKYVYVHICERDQRTYIYTYVCMPMYVNSYCTIQSYYLTFINLVYSTGVEKPANALTNKVPNVQETLC